MEKVEEESEQVLTEDSEAGKEKLVRVYYSEFGEAPRVQG